MEIDDRDEMGSERCNVNDRVEFVKLASVVGISLGDIPEWLLVELLIRLPVKFLFRFKLVSKKWLSVISDPSFVRMYIFRASASPQSQPWTFIPNTTRFDYARFRRSPQNRSSLDIHSSDFKHSSFYVLPSPSTEYSPRDTRYTIIGLSNGLVAVFSLVVKEWGIRILRRYGIWNPITGQYITPPPHAYRYTPVSCGFLTRVQNDILTSYGLVSLDVPLQKSNMIRFEVFLSEINEWKYSTVIIDQEIEVLGQRMPTALNGIVHWITRKHGIIAYDPYHNPESLRFIPLPRDIDPTCNDESFNGIPSLCDVHQGRLRYIESSVSSVDPHGFSGFGVWVLNDYSTGNWCLLHRVSSADIMYDDILSDQRLSLEPISSHPCDSDIVFLGHNNFILSYNMKTRKLSTHGGPFYVEDFVEQSVTGRSCAVWWRTFLLRIAPWPISIPHPSFGVTNN